MRIFPSLAWPVCSFLVFFTSGPTVFALEQSAVVAHSVAASSELEDAEEAGYHLETWSHDHENDNDGWCEPQASIFRLVIRFDEATFIRSGRPQASDKDLKSLTRMRSCRRWGDSPTCCTDHFYQRVNQIWRHQAERIQLIRDTYMYFQDDVVELVKDVIKLDFKDSDLPSGLTKAQMLEGVDDVGYLMREKVVPKVQRYIDECEDRLRLYFGSVTCQLCDPHLSDKLNEGKFLRIDEKVGAYLHESCKEHPGQLIAVARLAKEAADKFDKALKGVDDPQVFNLRKWLRGAYLQLNAGAARIQFYTDRELFLGHLEREGYIYRPTRWGNLDKFHPYAAKVVVKLEDSTVEVPLLGVQKPEGKKEKPAASTTEAPSITTTTKWFKGIGETTGATTTATPTKSVVETPKKAKKPVRDKVLNGGDPTPTPPPKKELDGELVYRAYERMVSGDSEDTPDPVNNDEIVEVSAEVEEADITSCEGRTGVTNGPLLSQVFDPLVAAQPDQELQVMGCGLPRDQDSELPRIKFVAAEGPKGCGQPPVKEFEDLPRRTSFSAMEEGYAWKIEADTDSEGSYSVCWCVGAECIINAAGLANAAIWSPIGHVEVKPSPASADAFREKQLNYAPTKTPTSTGGCNQDWLSHGEMVGVRYKQVEDVVTFVCDDHFMDLAGPSELKCVKGTWQEINGGKPAGVWNQGHGNIPHCRWAHTKCAVLSTISGGELVVDNGVATYKCLTGHLVVPGEKTTRSDYVRKCQADGSWLPDKPPTCEDKPSTMMQESDTTNESDPSRQLHYSKPQRTRSAHGPVYRMKWHRPQKSASLLSISATGEIVEPDYLLKKSLEDPVTKGGFAKPAAGHLRIHRWETKFSEQSGSDAFTVDNCWIGEPCDQPKSIKLQLDPVRFKEASENADPAMKQELKEAVLRMKAGEQEVNDAINLPSDTAAANAPSAVTQDGVNKGGEEPVKQDYKFKYFCLFGGIMLVFCVVLSLIAYALMAEKEKHPSEVDSDDDDIDIGEYPGDASGVPPAAGPRGSVAAAAAGPRGSVAAAVEPQDTSNPDGYVTYPVHETDEHQKTGPKVDADEDELAEAYRISAEEMAAAEEAEAAKSASPAVAAALALDKAAREAELAASSPEVGGDVSASNLDGVSAAIVEPEVSSTAPLEGSLDAGVAVGVADAPMAAEATGDPAAQPSTSGAETPAPTGDAAEQPSAPGVVTPAAKES